MLTGGRPYRTVWIAAGGWKPVADCLAGCGHPVIMEHSPFFGTSPIPSVCERRAAGPRGGSCHVRFPLTPPPPLIRLMAPGVRFRREPEINGRHLRRVPIIGDWRRFLSFFRRRAATLFQKCMV